jgi:hypothetical protein
LRIEFQIRDYSGNYYLFVDANLDDLSDWAIQPMESLNNFKQIRRDYGGKAMRAISYFMVIMLAIIFLLLSSPAIAQDYGSKVLPGDEDESRALSPFFSGPEFAFIDLNNNGMFEPTDPVYINMNPADCIVSENDIRVTYFENAALFPAGSQVRAAEPDHDKALIRFGTYRYPAAELRYFDMDGDKAYSLNDPVYLDLDPGKVTAGDIRITGYLEPVQGFDMGPGTRVRDADPDSDKTTITLPGMLGFYNANGNINNGGWAIYDTGDLVYMDTQYPFNTVTVNDIRLSLPLVTVYSKATAHGGVCNSPDCAGYNPEG